MMRILFVVKQEATLIEHLGLMYISGVLKAAGHECLGLAARDFGKVADTISEFQPGIIGFSMTTGMHQFHVELVQRLKREFDFVSVFGGPHPTYFPEIIRDEGIDVVCVGEGELPMLELVRYLEAGGNHPRIPNLLVKEGGALYESPPRPFLQDLDSLPFPDRELFGPPSVKPETFATDMEPGRSTSRTTFLSSTNSGCASSHHDSATR
jgi:anaerobic magnesium-protoporphyrin IX monomethyl ester cyclase